MPAHPPAYPPAPLYAPVNLSLPTGPVDLDARMLATIVTSIGAVPGLRFVDALPNHIGNGSMRTIIDYRGWSPSLHSSGCTMDVRHLPGPEAGTGIDDILEGIRTQIAMHLAVQASRAQAGLDHGIAFPLPTRDPKKDDLDLRTVEMRHLLIDEGVLTIAAKRDPDHLSTIADVISDIHDRASDDGRDTRLCVEQNQVEERFAVPTRGGDRPASNGAGHGVPYAVAHDADPVEEASPRRRIQRFLTLNMDMRPGVTEIATGDQNSPGSVTFDGEELFVSDNELPEAIALQLVGRPLRALALVHPAIDDRIITSIVVNPATDHEVGSISAYVDIIPVPLVPAPMPAPDETV